jgi:hypothetical protein
MINRTTINRVVANSLGLVGLLAACAAAPTAASAQDIGLHGFADVSYKNDYITPRGLPVTTEGQTVQVVEGLVLDFAQKPGGLFTDVALVGGTFMDWNPNYSPLHNNQGFNEFDWFVGANAKIGKDWKIGAQYVEFISPQNFYVTEQNVELSVAFDDSSYLKPINFQPYAKVFLATAGGSTVVTGRHGGTFDVELGAVPNIDLHPYKIPVILSAPTWITVGPSSFWGGGGNAGVFSTGLKATYPLKLPATAGHWAVYADAQYYHLINDQLVLAESILDGKSERDLGLFTIGVTLGF